MIMDVSSFRDLTKNQFVRRYLTVKEDRWAQMGPEVLGLWEAEVQRHGPEGRKRLLEAIGELKLPHERHLQTSLRVSEETPPAVILGAGQTVTPKQAREMWEYAMRELLPVAKLLGLVPKERTQEEFVLIPGTVDSLPKASTDSGETSTASAIVPGAVGPKATGQPSLGASLGAATSVANGYAMVAYQRLPLAGKRDAFIADGFLYVRNETLREWFGHLKAGRCCKPQTQGEEYHASDCWIGNAVR